MNSRYSHAVGCLPLPRSACVYLLLVQSSPWHWEPLGPKCLRSRRQSSAIGSPSGEDCCSWHCWARISRWKSCFWPSKSRVVMGGPESLFQPSSSNDFWHCNARKITWRYPALNRFWDRTWQDQNPQFSASAKATGGILSMWWTPSVGNNATRFGWKKWISRLQRSSCQGSCGRCSFLQRQSL